MAQEKAEQAAIKRHEQHLESQELTTGALGFLRGLENKGQLPGSDGKTMLMCFVDGPTDYPVSRAVFQRLPGGIVNHYTVTKDRSDAPWRLVKAWQADATNNVVQEFPIQ